LVSFFTQMFRIVVHIFLGLFIATLTTPGVSAQDLTPPADILHYMDDTAHWLIEIPLWVPGLTGTLSYGDITIDGGSGGENGQGILKDIFSASSKLDYFMVGKIRYTWKRLYAQGDVFGGQLDNSVKFTYNDQTLINTKIQLIMPRLFAGYNFIDHSLNNGHAGRLKSSVITGIRFYYTHIFATLPDPIKPIDLNTSWIDPYLGLALFYDLYKFSFQSQFDLGFRNVAAFENWGFMASCRYRFGPWISVELGWVMQSLSRHRDVLNKDLNIKFRLNGPSLGLAIHF
jgi:hypothetical protein